MKKSKVILITGASTGIGKDTALRYIKEGHSVWGAARSIEKMDDIVKAGGHAIKLDVTDQASIEACVNEVVKTEGTIDVLFNNAGYGEWGAVEDVTIERAKYQFEVNNFGLAAITKEVLPVMRKQRSGLIINTSSMGGKIYTPFGAWYHASKHALEGWSDCLRFEVKPFGIKVVILEPGSIDTPWNAIMEENMIKNSKDSAYFKMISNIGNFNRGVKPSPVSVITNVMVKIINARNPKFRYVKGSMARPVLFLRRLLGDRLMDRIFALRLR